MKFREISDGKYEAYRTENQALTNEKKPVKKTIKKVAPKNKVEKQSHK